MAKFQLFDGRQIASLRTGGKILRDCLAMLREKVTPGVTTKALDDLAESFIRDHDGIPAFKGYHGFPATLCTSVNEVCVHGIPGSRALLDGDIVSLDCGVIFDGLYTDSCITVGVGSVSSDAQTLMDVTERALENAIAIVRAGIKVGDISGTIQETVEAEGCTPVEALTGHGVGTELHQFPDIPNRGRKRTGPVIPAGTALAIEPIITLGKGRIRQEDDGWTINVADGSLAAHVEHTVLVTEDGCEILA